MSVMDVLGVKDLVLIVVLSSLGFIILSLIAGYLIGYHVGVKDGGFSAIDAMKGNLTCIGECIKAFG